ncbi:tRNA (adenosine(37)-N6)-threonylcarbamoyltransferase complex dimerization subunit type 1 TsaB [Enterococcus casseliflavus]|uniref:tRNA (adenosine(37)-N6)-threonylcarbamoyltransferase complex dimerization subunit type 1 TsaB n=1 Tax=Enterococcus TaxID=1350 RepID=UPI001E42EEBE|nr:tRNA (adenosine(37)-N6)-threonylcarbamoyltransferase complex dimerization subunit type 1 TsaB [Enterococcus casseliflavus]MCD5201223.1 tRNA (adenosine(37)-N6)-threonylcarbamoyltransferase complex dimerization subunit type 1 TsaB [Enterococcus casseliflavus]MCX4168496.1 tRNA (adenosine(37)-N6)-threonylcarbamoyltransferase complex dimerization subunit type 1 TsaB [Enterococcus casseliflavus]MDT2954163.1 tRNA (adenosine(37)-N6)-threonylcarbamoyltransferase complex dimerization subunit type 1 Tsa
MKTLAIDTSNQTLAVAVVDGQEVLGQSQTMAIKNHSTALMPAIDGLMQAVGMAPKELEQIVVAKGPGSYTGLRIGVTTAKTLAQTLNIPLIGVSSLKAVAANCVGVSQVIVPLFDARRQNVYAGAYQWHNGTLETRIKDQHISLSELLTQLKAVDGQEVLFVGADTVKFKDMIEAELPTAHINQVLLWNYPSGVVLAAIAKEEAPVGSIHDFVPDYLKLVEAEEKWLASHEPGVDAYVEKI